VAPEFLVMEIMIFISVFVYVGANIISAIIIIRRDNHSHEHLAFGFFFIGLAGYVFFYIFLQYFDLREFSYTLQLYSLSLGILGLFFFYYALAHGGKVTHELLVTTLIVLFLVPIICTLFHPFTFVDQGYGFELQIEPWFMVLAPVIYSTYGFYAIIGLIWQSFRSDNSALREKMKMLSIGLGIMSVFGMLFLWVIPITLEIHYLKPIGYFAFTFGSVIMTYAFKKKAHDKNG
jgi:hypothetical protein